MLVLTRRPNESIIIANNIKITVVSVGPGRVKLGIEAPSDVRIDRKEIHDKIEHSTDVLASLTGVSSTTDGPNTAIGHGADTALIVQTAPSETDTQPTNAPLPLNKLSKFRTPRKPR